MDQGRTNLKRYFPHVLVATLAVAVLPLLIVFTIRASGHLASPLLSMALAVLLSIVTATVGSACWMRHPGSKDLVFGDLMIWRWIRQLRAEKRLCEAAELLGIGAARGGCDDASLTPERKAEILEQLAGALESRDTYTHGHTRRVTRHAQRIAERMGLPRERVAQVRTAAAVHDVGKLNVPKEILNKPGSLSDEEFALMKRHPEDGAEMVAAIGDGEITAMVRHHHERLDGTGYPDGLAADDVPLGARIIAVADTFDAMTSTRSYRAACRHKKAIEVLKRESGSQLDPEAVRAFLGYYSGRKSLALWALLTEGPQRLLSWLGGAVQGAGTAPLAKGAAVVGVSAALGAPVVGPSPALDSEARVGPAGTVAVQSAAPGHRADGLDDARAVERQAGLRTALDESSRSETPVGFRLHSPAGASAGSGSEPADSRRHDGTATDSPSDPGTGPVSGSDPGRAFVPTSDHGGVVRSNPEVRRDSPTRLSPAPRTDSAPESRPLVDSPSPEPTSAPRTDSGSGSNSGSGSSGSGSSGSGSSGSGSGSSGSGSSGSGSSGKGSGKGSGSSGSGSSGSGSSGSGSSGSGSSGSGSGSRSGSNSGSG